jgi:hypothetical protein
VVLTTVPEGGVIAGRCWVPVLTKPAAGTVPPFRAAFGRLPKNDETPRSCQGAAGFLITG